MICLIYRTEKLFEILIWNFNFNFFLIYIYIYFLNRQDQKSKINFIIIIKSQGYFVLFHIPTVVWRFSYALHTDTVWLWLNSLKMNIFSKYYFVVNRYFGGLWFFRYLNIFFPVHQTLDISGRRLFVTMTPFESCAEYISSVHSYVSVCQSSEQANLESTFLINSQHDMVL